MLLICWPFVENVGDTLAISYQTLVYDMYTPEIGWTYGLDVFSNIFVMESSTSDNVLAILYVSAYAYAIPCSYIIQYVVCLLN